MKNKIIKSFVILFTVLLIPASVFATARPEPLGAGEWDFLGSESIRLGNGTIVIDSSKYWSGGGDYKLRITGAHSSNLISIWVTEEDPNGNSLVYSRIINGNANGEYVFSTRGFTDGSNGKAELRFEFDGSLQPYDDVVIEFYD